MSTIVTRAGKGSPLTNTEVDSNFTNLNTDKLESDGSVLADKIAFDTAAALTPTTGQMVWDAETGTVDIGLNGATAPVMSVGEDQFYRVINQTGSTITKGTLVMAFGTVGASGVIKVKAWDGSQASKTIMGLVMADIPTENDPTESGLGYILAFGKLKGIQTNGGNYGQTWANGDIIYAGASSGLTNVLPAAPNTKTTVAIVINAHATNGTLFVRPSYGSNLGEDELVQLASLANGDVLSYDSVDGRFENKTLAAAGIYAASNPAGYTTNTGTVTSVGGTGTVNGITLTGTVTSSGNLTLGGTLSGVNLTSQVTGTLPVANGGTGATTLTASAYLKGNGTSAITAQTGIPAGDITSGTLGVARGGTGITSFGTGVATWLGTPSSANLAAAVTDETGSGALVFANSPTLVTPALGTPSSGTLTNATGLPIVAGTTGTLSVARGGTGQTSYVNGELLIGNTTGNTLSKATLTAGSGVSITNGAGSITIAATGSGGTVTSVSGTGTVNGITLTGTVTSTGSLTLGGTLSNVSLTTQVTGTLPVVNGGTGITSFGTGVATWLGTPSSANLAAAVTDETGSGALVFATSPTLVTPILGTPQSGTLTNATGLPLSTGVTGTLPVANGGTGATSLTANNVLLGNGTSAVQVVAPGTSGNVLTSNGTTWTSAAAGASLTGVTESVSPFETALGSGAGAVNTGANNTFIGFEAGNDNTTGTANVALGFKSLDANTTGNSNVAIGSDALGANTTGTLNTAVGGGALQTNTTGNFNVAFGYTALDANTTASLNTAIGYAALRANTTASSNTAIGQSALQENTTGARNTSVGAGSLDANTTGSDNVALGKDALGSNTTASLNVAIGNDALRTLTTGFGANVAVGANALYSSTTADSNIAVGYDALYSNTTGGSNIAIGQNALRPLTTGNTNVAVGVGAGDNVTTGAQNVFLGHNAGNITTGNNNIIIGYIADASSATVSNEITLGNSSISALRCQVTTISSLSDARDKTNISDLPAGLGFINALRPVEFDWNMRDGGKVGIHDTGFIAQDLLSAQESTGVNIPDLVRTIDPERLEAGYGKLIPVLVKAIQELSAQVEQLKKGN